MGPFEQLLVVVMAMAVGTTVFGALPLVLPLHRSKLVYLQLVGSGLLLGAAFTVVIPEGVVTTVRASDKLHHHGGGPDLGHQDGGGSGGGIGSRLWTLCTDGETVVGMMLLVGFYLMFLYV